MKLLDTVSQDETSGAHAPLCFTLHTQGLSITNIFGFYTLAIAAQLVGKSINFNLMAWKQVNFIFVNFNFSFFHPKQGTN